MGLVFGGVGEDSLEFGQQMKLGLHKILKNTWLSEEKYLFQLYMEVMFPNQEPIWLSPIIRAGWDLAIFGCFSALIIC